MESYKKAIQLKPDFAEACNNIAAIYYRQGRHDLAARFDAKAKRLKESTSQLPEASLSSSLRARTK